MSAASETNEKFEQDVDEILNLATPGLGNPEIKKKLRVLIRNYRDVFSLPVDPLGTAVGVEHHIDIGDAKPFKISPRRRVIRMSKNAVWFDERPADFPKEYEQHIQRRPL